MSSLLNGFGLSLSAVNTIPILVTINVEDRCSYANRLRILNLGTNTIRARINTDVASFAASSGYALVIAPDSDVIELVADGKPPIYNIVLATDMGSTQATINAL
jgi:hypothetical protein